MSEVKHDPGPMQRILRSSGNPTNKAIKNQNIFEDITGSASIPQWLFLVPVKGGRDYITSQKAIYKWYILLIG